VNWETVIGLEVHVQLATGSKLFCTCSTQFGAPPNSQVCPVCLGLPGALPFPNEAAVRLAVRAATALQCTVHRDSRFARKNYFYPDLPKGYQISQFDRPLATAGRVSIESPDRGTVPIGVTRLHLEEDAGKSIHDLVPGRTALDFNRSGTPLVEIVSEPDLRSPGEARAYMVALKQVLEYLEVSDCNMEEGSLRVDANISVRPVGETRLGTKQEIKNMNSFAGVERALGILRDLQVETLERGEEVTLQTFSAATGELRRMRTKEESHDYRYFPDPDLPPLVLSVAWLSGALDAMPELPAARRARFRDDLGLSEYEADVLTSTRPLGDYVEAVVVAGADAATTAKWVMGPVLRDANAHQSQLRVAPARLAALISLVGDGRLSEQAAKRVFDEMTVHPDLPAVLADKLSLTQVADDDKVGEWIDAVLGRFPDEVTRYRAGEERLFGFFMGKVMAESGGSADPKVAKGVLKNRLVTPPG
jgi:aspartyl-tRNA(Asn)/glutamyl-tRNA(Gln) amidotransferase subunit B